MSNKQSKDQAPVLKKTDLSKSVEATLPKKKKMSLDPKSLWEDVEAIYQTCARGIVDVAEFARSTSSTFQSIPSEEVPRGVVTAIRGLAGDIDKLTSDLCRIHNNHKMRSGKIEDDLDHKLSLDIIGDYIEFQERFKAATFTPMLVLTEAIQEIHSKKQLQDPAVVSDAVVKNDPSQPLQEQGAV